jgi:methyl coenzyme M reductase beta subunit
VYATRIGGARNFLSDTGNKWVTDTIVDVRYGDITQEPFFDPKLMGLIPQVSELYVKNSRNQMVPLNRNGLGYLRRNTHASRFIFHVKFWRIKLYRIARIRIVD